MWDVFKTYFEQTHPDFFKTLYTLHPDLSPNEVRMCAYIMLNLTTKEIAGLTNRSSRISQPNEKHMISVNIFCETGAKNKHYIVKKN